MSNTKQIGLGVIQYAQDNDEILPGASPQAPYPNPNGYPTWRVRVYPYIKNLQVFLCPSEPKNVSTFDEILTDGTKITFPMGYKANGNLTGCAGSQPIPPSNAGVNLNKILVPAETIVITEGRTDQAYFDWNLVASPPSANRTMVAPHLGTANFIFADGHAKSMKLTATLTPRNLWSIEDDGACTSGNLFDKLHLVEADSQ